MKLSARTRVLFRYFLTALLTLLVFNLWLVPLLEPGLIYFPAKELESDPAAVGLDHESVFIRTADGQSIHGWFISNPAARKVILLLHGNGGNISHRLPLLRLLEGLPANVLIIDYRGYGESEGSPSENKLYLDAQAAHGFLTEQKKIASADIILYGSSLGGAVAVDLATKRAVGGVILESTFTSAREMASRLNPLYRRPLVWVRSRFDSLAKIGRIKAPLLIIHSREDEMIPYQMAEALFAKAAEPKELLLLKQGRHNDFMTAPEYIKSLQQIVK